VGTLCGAEPRPVRDLVTTGNGTTSTPRHRVVTAVRHRVHTAWRHRRLFTEIVACRINGQGVCLLVARDAAGSYSPADGVSRLCLVLRVRLYIVVVRSEEHTSELQSRFDLVCRLLLEKKKN